MPQISDSPRPKGSRASDEAERVDSGRVAGRNPWRVVRGSSSPASGAARVAPRSRGMASASTRWPSAPMARSWPPPATAIRPSDCGTSAVARASPPSGATALPPASGPEATSEYWPSAPTAGRWPRAARINSSKLWDVPSRKNTATLANQNGTQSPGVQSRWQDPVCQRQVRPPVRSEGEDSAVILKRCTGWSPAVAFDPKGKLLYAGIDQPDHSCFSLWNPDSGEKIVTYRGHTKAVIGIAFSRDGKMLASGAWDRGIRLWESASGKCTATFAEQPGTIVCLAFSPEGRVLAVSSLPAADRNTYPGPSASWRCPAASFSPLWRATSGRSLAWLSAQTADSSPPATAKARSSSGSCPAAMPQTSESSLSKGSRKSDEAERVDSGGLAGGGPWQGAGRPGAGPDAWQAQAACHADGAR